MPIKGGNDERKDALIGDPNAFICSLSTSLTSPAKTMASVVENHAERTGESDAGGPLTGTLLMQFHAAIFAPGILLNTASPRTGDHVTFYALYIASKNEPASSVTMSGPTTVEFPSPIGCVHSKVIRSSD